MRKNNHWQNQQQSQQTNEDSTSTRKKYTTFQITSFVLIVLLFVAIIIQVAVIISLNNKAKDMKDKLDHLPETQQIVAVTETVTVTDLEKSGIKSTKKSINQTDKLFNQVGV